MLQCAVSLTPAGVAACLAEAARPQRAPNATLPEQDAEPASADGRSQPAMHDEHKQGAGAQAGQSGPIALVWQFLELIRAEGVEQEWHWQELQARAKHEFRCGALIWTVCTSMFGVRAVCRVRMCSRSEHSKCRCFRAACMSSCLTTSTYAVCLAGKRGCAGHSYTGHSYLASASAHDVKHTCLDVSDSTGSLQV